MKNTLSPRIHIVILNWNNWKDTIECLESIYKQDYDNYQIVICDNDSQDDSVNKIIEWSKGNISANVSENHPLARLSTESLNKHINFTVLDRDEAEDPKQQKSSDTDLVLIHTGGNLGFAGGNNVGFRYALNQEQSDFIWLLNNDTVVEADALSKMVNHSQELHAKGVKNTCGNTVCFYDDPNIIQALGGASFNSWTGIASQTLGRFTPRNSQINHKEYQQKLDYITGCSWLLPRDFLEETGLMDERYFLYYEEIDWVLRSNNYTLTYAPDAYIYHKEGSSIGSKTLNKDSSLLSDFYMVRNKFKLAAKFKPWALPTVFLSTMLQAINRIRQGHINKAKLFIQIMFGKQYYP